ncbi:MAG: aromatic ring-hydroxylating dioxygenase subunit alpha [Actinomycetota bacterium]|nr:aromatic ring-hydroxylating dioxygenase subunit alpha [Actinomycetota bacterium]
MPSPSSLFEPCAPPAPPAVPRGRPDTPGGPGRRPGEALPRHYYVDDAVFAAEIDGVLSSGWLLAGHSCELPDAGDYLVVDVGPESVIVNRDRCGALQAHHNVCRHRGSRLTAQRRGHARSFVCPYHQWVYDLDGSLRSARLMGPDFCPEGYGLVPVALEELAGLLFISLAAEPPPFAPAAAAIGPQLAPHGLTQARVARRDHYRVGANWKTIVENNRECYHCRGSHPELCLSNFDLGTHGDVRRRADYDEALAGAYRRWEGDGLAPREVTFPDGTWYRVSRLPLKAGFRTESIDGRPVAPPLGSLGGADPGSLRLVGLPTMWAHANLDYAVTTRLTPRDPATTDIEVTFLVDAGAREGVDYDSETLSAVWRATCEQDWALCENNYAGIRSRAYRPGPLSPVIENSVDAFLDWYLDQMVA